MPKRLQLPYAETYTIQFTPSKKTKNLDLYVKEQLSIMHPGFSSDSLWDYIKLKDCKNVIKAVVLDRTYFVECRVKKSAKYFYIEENNIRYRLFSKIRFSNTGRKKNCNLFFIGLIPVILILILVLYIVFRPEQKGKEIIPEFTEQVSEVPSAVNIFDVFNYAARKVSEGKGSISTINYVYDERGKVRLLVNGIKPYDFVNQLMMNGNIENCRCTDISYAGSIENYEIQIDIKSPAISVEQKTNLELLELQNQITDFLHENNADVLNSSINQDFCKVDTELTADREKAGSFHENLQDFVSDNHMFITSFREQVDESNKCLIRFEVLKLNLEQEIEVRSEDEYISKVLPLMKTCRKEFLQINKEEEKKIETVHSENYTKIGSAIIDGKKLFYYRTEEGKLLTSEEEL